jgi:TfoX/Sxy family transcriptional regulator of competence genes
MAYDEALAERLREVLAPYPGVTEKRMFGGCGFLLDGNLTVSASGRGGLLLRVDPDRAEELLAHRHVTPFVMRGRAMAGWLHVGAEAVATDADLARWVEFGVARARSLPAS